MSIQYTLFQAEDEIRDLLRRKYSDSVFVGNIIDAVNALINEKPDIVYYAQDGERGMIFFMNKTVAVRLVGERVMITSPRSIRKRIHIAWARDEYDRYVDLTDVMQKNAIQNRTGVPLYYYFWKSGLKTLYSIDNDVHFFFVFLNDDESWRKLSEISNDPKLVFNFVMSIIIAKNKNI